MSTSREVLALSVPTTKRDLKRSHSTGSERRQKRLCLNRWASEWLCLWNGQKCQQSRRGRFFCITLAWRPPDIGEDLSPAITESPHKSLSQNPPESDYVSIQFSPHRFRTFNSELRLFEPPQQHRLTYLDHNELLRFQISSSRTWKADISVDIHWNGLVSYHTSTCLKGVSLSDVCKVQEIWQSQAWLHGIEWAIIYPFESFCCQSEHLNPSLHSQLRLRYRDFLWNKEWVDIWKRPSPTCSQACKSSKNFKH